MQNSTMDYFDELLTLLKQWDPLGSRITANGVRLIGHVPHVGAMAYLHSVYEPLRGRLILDLEEQIKHPLPMGLKHFFQRANGVRLFGNSLSIFGLRQSYDRTLSDAVYQPISIVTCNVRERIRNAPNSAVFFGYYDWDGSKLYMLNDDPRVFVCPRYAITPLLYEWPNFETFFLTEVKRLAALYDDQGRKRQADQPTVPFRVSGPSQ